MIFKSPFQPELFYESTVSSIVLVPNVGQLHPHRQQPCRVGTWTLDRKGRCNIKFSLYLILQLFQFLLSDVLLIKVVTP